MQYDSLLDDVMNPLFVPMLVNISHDTGLTIRYQARHRESHCSALTIPPHALALGSLDALSVRSLLFLDAATVTNRVLESVSALLRRRGLAFVVVNLPQPGIFWWAREDIVEPSGVHIALSDLYIPERCQQQSFHLATHEGIIADMYARNRLRHWDSMDWVKQSRSIRPTVFRLERVAQLGRMAVAKYYGVAVDGRWNRPEDAPDFTMSGQRVTVCSVMWQREWVLYGAEEEPSPGAAPGLTSDWYVFTMLEGSGDIQWLVTLCGCLDRQTLARSVLERQEKQGQIGWYYVVDGAMLSPLREEWE